MQIISKNNGILNKVSIMIYEIRTYTLKPGMVNEYVKHFKEVGLPIICKYSRLVGYWIPETGELNQLIHIWEYESCEDKDKKRAALYDEPEWSINFVPKAMEMLVKQESRIMKATNFSPIK